MSSEDNKNLKGHMEYHIRNVLSEIPHIDMSDPNLIDTPSRIARMYREVFWGLDPAKYPKLTAFPADKPYGMVGTGKIFFTSFCAHHFLPFIGHAHCFYIPNKKILGISKFTRIVDYFSARPQIQERLTNQIADAIMEATECNGCYVIMRATHGCMQCRGVKQTRSVMVTSSIRPYDGIQIPVPQGPFAKEQTRNEALMLMEMDK